MASKILNSQDLKDLKAYELTLPLIVKQLEKRIDRTTTTEKSGTLRIVHLLKRLEGLEQAITQEQLNTQKTWIKENNKPNKGYNR